MSDEHSFDEFLRKKLKNYEEGFIGSDWEQFNKKLQSRLPEKNQAKKSPVLLLLFLLFAAVAVIWLAIPKDFNQPTLPQGDKNNISETVTPDYNSGLKGLEEDKQQTGNSISEFTDKGQKNTVSNSNTEKKISSRKDIPNKKTDKVLFTQKPSNLNEQSREHDAINHKIASQENSSKNLVQKVNPAKQSLVIKKNEKKKSQLIPIFTKESDNKITKKEPKIKFPIEIGFKLTGGYSFMPTDVDAVALDHSVNRYYLGIQSSSQKHGFSYGANLMVKFPLSKTISVLTGIGTQHWDVRGEYNFNRQFIPVYDHLNKEIAYIVDPNQRHYQYSAQKEFSQIQIPIGGEIEIPTIKKFNFVLSGGLTYSIIKSGSGTTLNCIYLTNQSLNITDDIKNSYISWHFGAGVYLPISKKLRLGIIPEYHHSTENIFSNGNGVKWSPSGIDVTTTLLLKL